MAINSRCRVLVHFNFKKGSEEKGLKMIEKDIFELLEQKGCLGLELFQDAENPTHIYYSADWNSIEEAKRAQKEWEDVIATITNLCTSTPKREFYNLKVSHMLKTAGRK